MSRIGSKPIPIPDGVEVTLGAREVRLEAGKHTLDTPILSGVEVRRENGVLRVLCSAKDAQSRAYWGLTRALLANAVIGLSKGFRKELDIVGVGYRAQIKGRTINFSLGYSHPIEFPLPDGIEVQIEKNTHIVVSGYDKQVVGEVAARIRALRKPDPYKQKGIRYTGERLIKRAGKTGA